MSQRRLERVRELLKGAVAELLLVKSKDPRLKSVNITAAKVTPDLKKAIILYSVMGDEKERAKVQEALDKASGFVRASLGEHLQMKFSPQVKFEFDKNLAYAQHMNDLLNTILPKDDSRNNNGREVNDD